jgi:hypothetical protein
MGSARASRAFDRASRSNIARHRALRLARWRAEAVDDGVNRRTRGACAPHCAQKAHPPKKFFENRRFCRHNVCSLWILNFKL